MSGDIYLVCMTPEQRSLMFMLIDSAKKDPTYASMSDKLTALEEEVSGAAEAHQSDMSNSMKQSPDRRIDLSACVTEFHSCANEHADRAADALINKRTLGNETSKELYAWHSGAYMSYTLAIATLQMFQVENGMAVTQL